MKSDTCAPALDMPPPQQQQQLALVGGLAAVCTAAGAALLLLLHRDGDADSDAKAGRRRKKSPAAAQKGRANDEGDRGSNSSSPAARRRQQLVDAYGAPAAAIPLPVLERLVSLVASVHARRGWRDARYLVTRAWARVAARAEGADGGGWAPQFEEADVTDARLAALGRVIDEELLGGAIAAGLLDAPWQEVGSSSGRRRKGRRSSQQEQVQQQPQQEQRQQQQEDRPHRRRAPIAYRAVNAPRAGWLAHFDDAGGGAVVVNRARCAKAVSPAMPLNCEGVVCASRLAVLMHTLAHELVHAVVLYAFPDVDAACPAYLADGRHGPVFALLNRQLFGHTSNALARCDARAALGGF